MLRKIVRKFKSFFYALPFGMKAADEVFTTSQIDSGHGTTIEQNISKKNVYSDLLQGEISQEVEELRYETFKAEELANDYQYIGNGQAVKIEDSEENKAKRRYKFFQENLDIDYGVQETLVKAELGKENDKLDFKTRKLFKIRYNNSCVRFNLESYLSKVRIILKGNPITRLYFIDDKTYKKNVPLINELKRIKKELNDGNNNLEYISRQEILASIEEMEFTTFRASNNVPNGIYYKFKKPKFESIGLTDEYVILEFSWKEYEGGKLLSEIYYSESADKKIKNKEKREGYTPIVDVDTISKNLKS